MIRSAIDASALPKRAPGIAFALKVGTSLVDWFNAGDKTGEHADVWVDHHRIAHERRPDSTGRVWCGAKILGDDAPSHSRVHPVGCRACIAARPCST